MNLRELILDMLFTMEKEGTYSNILIKNVLDKYDYLEAQEKAFVKRVAEGTLERRIQLDYIINNYSKVPVKKMKPLIRSLLRMSVYQLLFMDGVPDSAVCNEAVKLAEKRKFGSLKGFVNGVLRTIARNKKEVLPKQSVSGETEKQEGAGKWGSIYPDREKNPTAYLSVIYSMPEWLVTMWQKEYGMEQTEKMLQAMLAIHPVTVRMKENVAGKRLEEAAKTELLHRIRETGAGIEPHPYLPYAYTLTHLEGLYRLPGFAEGLFTVQDVSSMLSVECAGIKAGDFVVDVCAAPGGKSTLAAEKLNGTGKVLARDISEEKVSLIEENVERQQLSNIETQVFDATCYEEALYQKADVVLADLPCSGLGILGKKRDIKYHMNGDILQELPELQKKILDTVWQYVKPGGVLLYSTCTVRREENEEILRWFLDNYPFTAGDISKELERIPENGTAKEGYIQLIPGVHDTDGFFFAKLIRNKE